MMNHRALVNLRDGDLNLVLMVAKKDDHLMIHLMKGDRLMIHLMKDDRLMGDLNSLVDLNYRDALPCAYSLISINI
jgi:hypothetical protein